MRPPPKAPEPREWVRGDDRVSTDPAALDLAVVHGFLTECYWARGIPRETVARSLDHSLPFGLYRVDRQIGFARVITDYATFAYVGDVFVLDAYRGQGLARWLMECVASHPDLQGLRRWLLATRDAHGLYKHAGYTPLARPEMWMERWFPDVYRELARDP